jgi:hypothetical protein
MPANFTITVNRVFTETEGNLTNVVKKAEWTLTGTQEGQTFSLPQTTDMNSADPNDFVSFENLTEANVIAWIEGACPSMDAIEAHIQLVLDRECAKAALESPALPWAPEPQAEPVT